MCTCLQLRDIRVCNCNCATYPNSVPNPHPHPQLETLHLPQTLHPHRRSRSGLVGHCGCQTCSCLLCRGSVSPPRHPPLPSRPLSPSPSRTTFPHTPTSAPYAGCCNCNDKADVRARVVARKVLRGGRCSVESGARGDAGTARGCGGCRHPCVTRWGMFAAPHSEGAGRADGEWERRFRVGWGRGALVWQSVCPRSRHQPMGLCHAPHRIRRFGHGLRPLGLR